MKKLLALLLAVMMVLSLAACGGGDDEKTPASNNDKTPGTSGQMTQKELDELDDAFEKLEALKPEGWDENDFGTYIYDVYDTSALPDCFPDALPDGALIGQTQIKDYSHDTYGQDYSVGRLDYESYEDYRDYSASFYCTWDQLDAFVAQLNADGLHGGLYGEFDDWYEYDFYNGEWYMHIFYNTRDDKDGEFDGCATVSATSDIWENPESIAGVPLPQTGLVSYDYSEGIYYMETYNFDTGEDEILEFDIANDSFPSEGISWWVYIDYYGTTVQDARDYAQVLVGEGWSLESEWEGEGTYNSRLLKDGVYAVSNFTDDYHFVGFSDMIENIEW